MEHRVKSRETSKHNSNFAIRNPLGDSPRPALSDATLNLGASGDRARPGLRPSPRGGIFDGFGFFTLASGEIWPG